ncbi:MAG TPA: hypothetical protein VGH54_19635 [Mycobacterium sp.]
MAVTELAEVSVAYYLGEVIAMSGIPIVGLSAAAQKLTQPD